MTSDEPIKLLQSLKGVEWSTKTGCLKYAIVVFVLTSFVIIVLKKTGIPLSQSLVILVLIASQLVHFILWLLKRFYIYGREALVIAFAINADEPSRSLYKEIKKKFREQIATCKLQREIVVKELPSDISFADSKAAESYIENKEVNLLIWGHTEEGNVHGSPFSLFRIKLTYLFRTTGKTMQQRFGEYIDFGFQRRKWGISHPESFHDLTVVAGNVFETSLYTLGACLTTVPAVHYQLKSVDIFEKLRNILKDRRPDVNFPTVHEVTKQLRSLLLSLYLILVAYYWENKKDLDKGIEYAQKILKLDDNNFIAHQNMAVFEWLKGNKNKAYLHTKKAWDIKPGHSLPRFNKAFFYICERKYEQALKQYKRIEVVEETNIVEVIDFLEKEFEKTNDNLGFLFAAGWLNFKHADQMRGVQQLGEFVAKSVGNTIYKPLAEEAEQTLKAK